ncbi:MAG: hypothetical protein GC155_17370 [Alphaproteobacteria bacterium]|nr:hypothetical protein [Alphaproteobacteria bacterium]
MRVSAIFPPDSDGSSWNEGRGAAVDGVSRSPLAFPGHRPTMRQYAFTVLFALAACATASTPPGPSMPAVEAPSLSPAQRAAAFDLGAPPPEALGPELRLWATRYHTPAFRPAPPDDADTWPLVGATGEAISPPLRRQDWCAAALQGSLTLKGPNGRETAYAYVDADGPEQADCDDKLGTLPDGVKRATRRARFRIVRHAAGCGVRQIPLAPFRTIAVDPDVIPLESLVYVPELRGRPFTLDGHTYLHDGYLFAGDRGGAIHGRHIDIFTADGRSQPLSGLISSSPSRTFGAYIVDPNAAGAPAALRAQQDSICTG